MKSKYLGWILKREFCISRFRNRRFQKAAIVFRAIHSLANSNSSVKRDKCTTLLLNFDTASGI
jgi:hypothetical protein